MRFLFVLFTIFFLFTVPISIDAFAQTSYDVNIPTGAASPDAPYFWQSEKDGTTTGVVEILTGDTIVWKNADSAAHTVTSGSASLGPDDVFDSGLFAPGKSFSYKFTETGHYPYFCLVHPWMEGAVIVTDDYSIIPNVGKQIGDGATFFDVEYDFNRVLSTAVIDEEQKSITFEIIGNTNSEDHNLELRLPSELIDGQFVIWVDGEKLSDYEQIRDGDLNVLFIPLNEDSKMLTIIGTSVVPEFGSMAVIIFGISVVSVVILNQRFRPLIRFN